MIHIPSTQSTALSRIRDIAAKSRYQIRHLPTEAFLSCWHSIFFCCPGLHPDDVCNHGRRVAEHPFGEDGYPHRLGKLRKYYVRSGWPIALAHVCNEARRRQLAGEFEDEEYYCYEVAQAGMRVVGERVTS
jgi:hypothetical protein